MLARNVLWNLTGQAAPVLVAIVAIPILIHGLGTARFGILALAWVVIGYFSLFDIGIGRALTQLVAQRLGTPEHEDLPTLIGTSLVLMLALGLVGATVLAPTVPWLVHHALKIPTDLQAESTQAFNVLLLSIPVVITSAGLRGLLEAQQRFDLSNAVRTPMGVLTFLAPLLVLPFAANLFAIVVALLIVRLVAGAAYLWMCLATMPVLVRRLVFSRKAALALLGFGGWMTVTNVVGPLLTYLDRFLIGVLISATAVAYYATPYEVVTKLLVIPAALVGVLFPAFAVAFIPDQARTRTLFIRGTKYAFIGLFPAALVSVTLAHDGLNAWLGKDFAAQGTPVLQWLAVGVLLNSLAQVAFTLIQGAGRPDLTAKVHLIELPVYVVLLFALLKAGGIQGAAIAWTARVATDMVVMFLIAFWLLPGIAVKRMVGVLAISLLLLALAALQTGVSWKLALLGVALIVFPLVAYFALLSKDERALVSPWPTRRGQPTQITRAKL